MSDEEEIVYVSFEDESSVPFVDTTEHQWKWTREETLLLINLVGTKLDEFESKMKKIVWRDIADEITKNTGKKISGIQCDTKWKLLKKMYKKVRDEKNQSGNGRRTWEFYEVMNNLLSKKPEIVPIATCKSTSKKVIINENMSPNSEGNTTENIENVDSTPVLKRRKRDSSVERRHQERLARQDRYLDLFEQTVKKM